MKFNKSFTLIELLIVVGIIGVLSGVVLVIVNPEEQRNKARDAVIKAELTKLGVVLASHYNSTFTEVSLTTLDDGVDNMVLCLNGAFRIEGVAANWISTSYCSPLGGFYLYTPKAGLPQRKCIGTMGYTKGPNKNLKWYVIDRLGHVKSSDLSGISMWHMCYNDGIDDARWVLE